MDSNAPVQVRELVVPAGSASLTDIGWHACELLGLHEAAGPGTPELSVETLLSGIEIGALEDIAGGRLIAAIAGGARCRSARSSRRAMN